MHPFSTTGLITGVGSLPFSTAEPALDLIWQSLPLAPHWPQLPKAGHQEGFSSQYVQALVRLGLVCDEASLYFTTNSSAWVAGLTAFYDLYLTALDGDEAALANFAFPLQAARGFYAFVDDIKQNGTRQAVCLKGQLSGPLTVGFQLTDPDKKASYYDSQLRDIVVKNLALHAIWQVKTLQQFKLPVIMMVDDPSLYAYGASTHVTLTREEIIADLNTVFQGIKQAGAKVGTHVCAGMDWTLLFDTDVEIINFDAYGYFDSMKVYAGRLNEFLTRGGVISWGIVPTSQTVLDESAASLFQRFKGYVQELEDRGIERELLLRQSMYTPSCGAGTLSLELADKIYATLQEFGRLVKQL
ncbi:MAG: hypothetical protein M0Z55_06825 [Peptococcaceae bacterium]|nr:hypothetical protein [Peptococcaceae bacterium]